MPASAYVGSFHVDHIVARQHGGKDVPDNLALACLHCNQRKGPNIAGRRTAIGGVTIQVLAIDDPGFRAVRIALRDEGIGDWEI